MDEQNYNEILKLGGIECAELLSKPGFINLNYDDIAPILKDAKSIFKASGRADSSVKAAQEALKNLADKADIAKIKNIIIAIKTYDDCSLSAMSDACDFVRDAIPQANLVWGHVIDEELGGDVIINLTAAI
ncbi:MAG: hypothetical protein II870_03680 [Synergistaceae bacterium]|nr:hypothetical protein [Synergistaceae bacterium]